MLWLTLTSPQIFANPAFSATPELWVLQAILLTECFGKTKAGQKQHDMSHLFHGLLINLIRRSECQTAQPESIVTRTDDLDQQWREWADLEQKKRLAQICFILDVEHAVLFSQSLCMSAFELRSTLPCSQKIWEATSAKDWSAVWRQHHSQPPLLLTELKAYLVPGKSAGRKDLNLLSRVILLHGLMSVAWDMTRRDQTSLGMLGNDMAAGLWKTRMSSSYDLWKEDFDQWFGSMESLQLQQHNRSSAQDRNLKVFKNCCHALYRAAHMVLLGEVLDLQIYAGARHILGRPVTRVDYSRSIKVVKQWTNRDRSKAKKAVWHAAWTLKSTLEPEDDGNLVDTFSYPWTLYLAALVLWSFHHAGPTVPHTHPEDGDDMIWDARSHMKRLLDATIANGPTDPTPIPPLGGNPTAGMASVVASKLSKVRWAICHDAMLVLKGLVPWRLIGEGQPRF